MSVLRVIVACIMLALVAGCASNVTFYEEVGSNYKAQGSGDLVVRVYVDAFGNIYPEGKGVVRFGKDVVENGSLYDQFSCHKELCEADSELKSQSISLLCGAIQDSSCTKEDSYVLPIESWRTAQTQLWKDKGREIYKKASSDSRDILFMIHGFNNYPSGASRSFKLIREKVQEIEKTKPPLFVEIYWDGFKGPPLSGSWSSAQVSGPLVGFQMRQLFKAIENEYRSSQIHLPSLMFVTHSSGAFVAASILGNPYSALPLLYDDSKKPSPEYRNFKDKRDGKDATFPIPRFPEIRLGMIAAATPSNTFTGSPKIDNGVEGGVLSNNTTLIFTINWKDTALTKYVGLMNVNPSGATGAGQDADLYCSELKTVKGHPSKAFDLSEGGFLFWNSHGLDAYMERKNIDKFIGAVLGREVESQFTCI